jgi:hypothetical protein
MDAAALALHAVASQLQSDGFRDRAAVVVGDARRHRPRVFLAAGLAAHALDELHGRPLGTDVITADRPVSAGALGMTVAATGLSYTQRRLSTPARTLRRRVSDIHDVITMADGARHPLDRVALLAPMEAALKKLSITTPTLAVALLLARTRT